MATASFDEKVVVTDPETVAKMKAELDDPTPVILRDASGYTQAEGQENARKWMQAHGVKMQ